jgi:hypothetical protein
LLLQSRGHFLDGGERERQFALFKTWATTHQQKLWGLLADRYVLYGEWLYAKHTIFYDALPHYFFEFDLLDVETGEFLSTDRRRELLKDSPLVSAPVLWRGLGRSVEHLQALVSRSRYKTEAWRDRLLTEAQLRGQVVELIQRQTDNSDLSEGLYIKAEVEGRVVGRYKFVRASFLQAVSDNCASIALVCAQRTMRESALFMSKPGLRRWPSRIARAIVGFRPKSSIDCSRDGSRLI